jgi:hypothetical protein
MRKMILLLGMLSALIVHAQQSKPQEGSGHAAMNSRGDQAMGFSHEKTTHHFRLYKDGGAIEVSANDAKDTDSRDMIRTHLAHIAKMFAAGNFETPMLVHDTTPPGATAMAELRAQIRYSYQDMRSGGRVRIETANAKAIEAVHSFLRFQIAEHKTEDSAKIVEEAASAR